MIQEDPTAPTQRLVDFYRQTVKDMRGQYLDFLKEIEACRELATISAFKEDEAIRQMKDTADLQETMSELQHCLFRERENVLKLTRENDRLGLEQLDSRKKIEFLLETSGLHESELSLENRCRRIAGVENKRKVRFKELKNFNKNLEQFKESEVDILRLKVQSLEAQLEEETEVLKDELSSLLNDVEIRKKEWESQKKVLTQRIDSLTCRLKHSQLFKFSELASFLEELDQVRGRDIKLIEENEKLKKCISICKKLIGDEITEDKCKKQETNLHLLKKELKEKDKIMQDYINQTIGAKEHVNLLKDILDKEKRERQSDKEKMINKEEYYKKKLEEEKKRRLLETEGFMSDIKLLRSKVQSIERQIRQENLKKRHIKTKLSSS